MKTSTIVGSLALLLAVVVTGTGLTFASQNPAADKLSKVAWIQGSWKADVNGDYLDEFWSPPHADSMIGMFRWSKKGTLWMSEMLSIVTDGDNIVLRVKHFDRSMVGWEEKDKAITLPLATQTDSESVFETADQSGVTSEAVRLTYRKTGADTMDVILDVKKKEEQRHHEFHFTRTK